MEAGGRKDAQKFSAFLRALCARPPGGFIDRDFREWNEWLEWSTQALMKRVLSRNVREIRAIRVIRDENPDADKSVR
jgi:hypothetical protein